MAIKKLVLAGRAGRKELGSNSWGLLSSFVALIGANSAHSQAFGRFGFSEIPKLPTFELKRDGFRARSESADQLKFWEVLPRWVPKLVNGLECGYEFPNRSLCPSRIRISLCSPGFEAYFPDGIGLQCSSLQAPFLSWADGSAGQDVAVPPSHWLAISFQDAQPPILLSFLDKQTSLQVVGKPGAWKIKSPLGYKGWVKFGLPTGLESFETSGVARLGQLSQRVVNLADYWTQSSPKLVAFSASEIAGGVVGQWTFDRIGAAIPEAANSALAKGYGLKLLSKVDTLKTAIAGLPRAFAATKDLKIFLPMAPRRRGRPIILGKGALVGPDLSNPPGIFSASIASLFANAPESLGNALTAGNDEFLSHLATSKEPVSGRHVPFDSGGRGYHLAAIQALMSQCADTRLDRDDELFESCRLGFDWLTWLPTPESASTRARTGAYLALAGVVGNTSERVFGGLFHAGVLASTGSGSLDVLGRLRAELFRSGSKSPFALALASPLQLIAGPPVFASREGSVVKLRFAQGASGRVAKIWMREKWEIIDVSNSEDFAYEKATDGFVLRVTARMDKTAVVALGEKAGAKLPYLDSFPSYTEQIIP